MPRAWRAAVMALIAPLAAGAQGPTPGQLPAKEWPPGWKLYAPYPEELSFMSPQATTKVASEVRTLKSGINDDKKFRGNVISERILIDNPYLDPNDPFFGIPRRIACLPDGGVAVSSTAKHYQEGRFTGNPYATGFWRIAPDGAITPIASKNTIVENSPYYPICGMPYAKSKIGDDIKPITLAPDGSLVFPYNSSILRLTPGGRVEHVPNRPEFCAAENGPKEPFNKPEAVVQDSRATYGWPTGARCGGWAPTGR